MSRASARAATVRRRRIVALLIALAALIAVIGTLLPTVDKAVKEVTLPLRHEDIIRQQSADKEVDASLIAAVIYAESRFDSGAHSEAPRDFSPVSRPRRCSSSCCRRSCGLVTRCSSRACRSAE